MIRSIQLQVLQFVHGVAANLGELEMPGAAEMALQLFLTATPASSEAAGLELITYDFFEQACSLLSSNLQSTFLNYNLQATIWLHIR